MKRLEWRRRRTHAGCAVEAFVRFGRISGASRGGQRRSLVVPTNLSDSQASRCVVRDLLGRERALHPLGFGARDPLGSARARHPSGAVLICSRHAWSQSCRPGQREQDRARRLLFPASLLATARMTWIWTVAATAVSGQVIWKSPPYFRYPRIATKAIGVEAKTQLDDTAREAESIVLSFSFTLHLTGVLVLMQTNQILARVERRPESRMPICADASVGCSRGGFAPRLSSSASPEARFRPCGKFVSARRAPA
jgi:hypothetical protein